MAKMTRAQAVKRLEEADRKVRRVWGEVVTDDLAFSTRLNNDIVKVSQGLKSIISRMKRRR